MSQILDYILGNTLTRVVFFPTLACLPLLLLRRANAKAIKQYTLSVALIELGLTVTLISGRITETAFRPLLELGSNGQLIPWIERYGITYSLALDGIALPLVALTALLLPLVVLGSWKGIQEHWIGYSASLLLLTTGMLGALLAADLFLFYVFWEVMLIPMYLLIGIWGGERRIYAAIKFFLFTMAGSLLMLLGILWMGWTYYQIAGNWSFHLTDLLRLQLPIDQQLWLFGAFALAFAIKVPMFPFHTWLPDAHVEAPTGGSVILAGVLLKLGTYGFLRFAIPLFPHAALQAQPLLITLAVIGILYGGLIAWAQEDMKKLVAFAANGQSWNLYRGALSARRYALRSTSHQALQRIRRLG
jgi:NADH-quinone oxidoreductase subunit M